MTLSRLPLNALRAFEAAARHLSLTRAAEDLCVTQAAVSHQVKALEQHVGRPLFRRTARGLVLTDEGERLAPVVREAFLSIEATLSVLLDDGPAEVLTVGVVGTFAVGFLLERLPEFRALYPRMELRMLSNNNKVDLVAESLDFAVRFGDGAWRSEACEPLLRAPLTPLCAPALAATLRAPGDLARVPLLRSYRAKDWPTWLNAAGVGQMVPRGPLFDTSAVMVQAAMLGEGVALAPAEMFTRELRDGRLARPFALQVDAGGYWLTRLLSREPTPAMLLFRRWLLDQCRLAAASHGPSAQDESTAHVAPD
ncbi:MAG: LysR family transcriptional regulator [Rubrivivax sp.]|nr:MAG: LysR family transcriptional regulator [Rubrivivax sp.]